MTTRVPARLALALSPLLLAFAVLFAPATALAQMKIAIIDLRRAVADTEDGLRMKSKLQELFDSRQSEYEGKEKEYAKAKDELEKMAKEGKAKEDVLRQKYALLEKQALELQAQGMNFRREMTQRENDLMLPILNKLNALVRQVASQESYDIVVNKEAVPYFRGDLEITDKVIQMYNAAAPQPAPEDKDKKPTKGPKKAAETQAPSPDGASPDAPPPAPKPEEKKPAKKKK